MVVHLGLRLRGDEADLHISRDNFIGRKKDGSYRIDSPRIAAMYDSDPSLLDEKLERAFENYAKNMAYYSSLERTSFESELGRFLGKHREFREKTDLSSCDHPGAYLMVLDDFKQVYIGKTIDSIKTRIRNHWNEKFPVDRIILGTVDTSRLPIDCFGALDTTRVFVWKTSNPAKLENSLIEDFDDAYLCNRTAGGDLRAGLIEAIARRRPPRDLSRF